jgi:NAD-dependent SIR2 family protein deacetylase
MPTEKHPDPSHDSRSDRGAQVRDWADAIARAARCIAEADAILVTAGAGMGVDSGLPDFRGPAGFWKAYPGLGRHRLGFTDIACPAAFKSVPRLAWGFYGHRLKLYRETRPHEGFAVLQRLAHSKPKGLRVFTSNVDGQFQLSGIASAHVVECHGSIHRLQCMDDCGRPVWLADDLSPDIDEAACEWRGALPTCPQCGALARPNILMFDDWGWAGDRYEAAEGELVDWLGTTRRPVVVELGAGTAIPSVRLFGERTRRPLVRINVREPDVPRPTDVAIGLGAREALEAIEVAVIKLGAGG